MPDPFNMYASNTDIHDLISRLQQYEETGMTSRTIHAKARIKELETEMGLGNSLKIPAIDPALLRPLPSYGSYFVQLAQELGTKAARNGYDPSGSPGILFANIMQMNRQLVDLLCDLLFKHKWAKGNKADISETEQLQIIRRETERVFVRGEYIIENGNRTSMRDRYASALISEVFEHNLSWEAISVAILNEVKNENEKKYGIPIKARQAWAAMTSGFLKSGIEFVSYTSDRKVISLCPAGSYDKQPPGALVKTAEGAAIWPFKPVEFYTDYINKHAKDKNDVSLRHFANTGLRHFANTGYVPVAGDTANCECVPCRFIRSGRLCETVSNAQSRVLPAQVAIEKASANVTEISTVNPQSVTQA